jgi:hypothetical protein
MSGKGKRYGRALIYLEQTYRAISPLVDALGQLGRALVADRGSRGDEPGDDATVINVKRDDRSTGRASKAKPNVKKDDANDFMSSD